jgi:hypothetical protein
MGRHQLRTTFLPTQYRAFVDRRMGWKRQFAMEKLKILGKISTQDFYRILKSEPARPDEVSLIAFAIWEYASTLPESILSKADRAELDPNLQGIR